MDSSSRQRRIDPLLSTEEVAQLLGITPRSVRQMATDGALTRIKLGRRTVRFAANDVQALIERSTIRR